MSWCTSGVGLQVLIFIGNRHLWGAFTASSNFLVFTVYVYFSERQPTTLCIIARSK